MMDNTIKQKLEDVVKSHKKYRSFFSYEYRLFEPLFKVLYKKIRKLSTGLFIILTIVYSRKIKAAYAKIYVNWLQKTLYFKM